MSVRAPKGGAVEASLIYSAPLSVCVSFCLSLSLCVFRSRPYRSQPLTSILFTSLHSALTAYSALTRLSADLEGREKAQGGFKRYF
jgi:hypothetical protein